MKNIMKNYFLVLLTIVMALISCEEEEGPAPLEANSQAPGQVTDIQVQNLPGKVKLSYKLPKDQDLLYIKAVYNLENGMEMEVKASYYDNTMLLEGFSGQQEIEVNIFSVNRSETSSQPVTLTVQPEEAPIFEVFRSLSVSNDFGGLRLTANNPFKDNVAVLVMTKNQSGDFEPVSGSVYTSQESISQSVRGYDTIPKEFAFAVRDRWQNVTDTLYQEIVPLFEMVIPTTGYRSIRLANDPPAYPENQVPFLWDGNTQFWPGVWVTRRDDPTKDHTVTFDMGQTVKLSRLKIWDYPELVNGVYLYYYLGIMKTFKIWGTNETPDPNGSFDNWTLLGEYTNSKPSGLPYGQQNNEDVLTAQAGISYDIPLTAPKVRYIRIQNLVNYAGTESLAISEILAYGDPR